MKKVSTRFYVMNQGLKNQNGERIEQAYVQLNVDGDTVQDYTLQEWRKHDDIWELLAELGFALEEIEDYIDFDPLEYYYKIDDEDDEVA